MQNPEQRRNGGLRTLCEHYECSSRSRANLVSLYPYMGRCRVSKPGKSLLHHHPLERLASVDGKRTMRRALDILRPSYPAHDQGAALVYGPSGFLPCGRRPVISLGMRRRLCCVPVPTGEKWKSSLRTAKRAALAGRGQRLRVMKHFSVL